MEAIHHPVLAVLLVIQIFNKATLIIIRMTLTMTLFIKLWNFIVKHTSDNDKKKMNDFINTFDLSFPNLWVIIVLSYVNDLIYYYLFFLFICLYISYNFFIFLHNPTILPPYQCRIMKSMLLIFSIITLDICL